MHNLRWKEAELKKKWGKVVHVLVPFSVRLAVTHSCVEVEAKKSITATASHKAWVHEYHLQQVCLLDGEGLHSLGKSS